MLLFPQEGRLELYVPRKTEDLWKHRGRRAGGRRYNSRLPNFWCPLCDRFTCTPLTCSCIPLPIGVTPALSTLPWPALNLIGRFLSGKKEKAAERWTDKFSDSLRKVEEVCAVRRRRRRRPPSLSPGRLCFAPEPLWPLPEPDVATLSTLPTAPKLQEETDPDDPLPRRTVEKRRRPIPPERRERRAREKMRARIRRRGRDRKAGLDFLEEEEDPHDDEEGDYEYCYGDSYCWCYVCHALACWDLDDDDF